MRFLGNLTEDQIIDFKFSTHTAAGAPITLAGTPVVKVYKGNSTTTETATGVTLTVDFDTVTGLHNVRIDTSADAFYAVANDYSVVITTGTVDSVSVVGTVLATFSIENRFMEAVPIPTMAAPLGVDVTGGTAADGHFDLAGKYPSTGDYPYFKLNGGAYYLWYNTDHWAISIGVNDVTGPDWVGGAALEGNYTAGAGGSGTAVVAITRAADVAAILVDTAVIGALGAGLTAIPWNSAWDTEVESECNDALIANNLDHVAKTATAAADMTTEVSDNTILARLFAGGDTSTFTPGTHDAKKIATDAAAILDDTGTSGVVPIPTMAAPLGIDVTGGTSADGHHDLVSQYPASSGYPYFRLRDGSFYTWWNTDHWAISIGVNDVTGPDWVGGAALEGNYTAGAGGSGTAVVAITRAADVAAIKAQTDQFAFTGGRVKAVAQPSHGGIGDNSFQFKLTSAAAEAKIISSGGSSVVDTPVLDATQRETTYTAATTGTQWQLTISVLQNDPGWTEDGNGNPWIEFSSSDEAVATVNSEGLVAYVGNGTCDIVGVSQASEYSPSQRFAVSITNTSSGGQTSVVTTWIADTFDAAEHMLVVYNADVANSVTLKNYYLANRPGMATANTLGLTGLADTTSTTSANVDNLILTPIYDWLVANEATKPVRYIVFMRGVPRRAGSNGSVGYMVYDLLNAEGYRVSSNGYKGGESRFTRGQYQGATCLPTWIDMGSYTASTAYVAKLATAVAGLQADGVTIDGSVAGVAGSKWLFDEKRSLADPPYEDQNAEDAAQVVTEGIAAGDVTYQDSQLGPAVASLADPLFYGSWGYYTWGENLPDDVTFTGLAGWWVADMVQSYGGIYEGYGGTKDYMVDPTEIFAATAFGGAAYSNTPVGYVGYTDEPYLGGVQTQHYPGRWARGWTFAEAAWVGRNTHRVLMVGDPLVTR